MVINDALGRNQIIRADEVVALNENSENIGGSEDGKNAGGEKVPVKTAMICPECRSWIDNAAKMCPICGPRIKHLPRPASEGRSRITAALLALFLGVAGAHKFYLGRIKMGIIYILISLTAIGFAITLALSIYDAIILFTMSDEEFARNFG
jgi:TM2 domain-containing membrane protein YozV